MDSLVLIAGAVPLAIIVIVFGVLATVRCSITESHLRLRVMGVAIRNVPLANITMVSYIKPGDAPGGGMFNRGGIVVVEYDGATGKGAMSVSPADAEGIAIRLRERVQELTGRRV